MTTSNCKNDEQRSWKIAGNTATLLGHQKGSALGASMLFFCPSTVVIQPSAQVRRQISTSLSCIRDGETLFDLKLARWDQLPNWKAQVIRPRPGKWKYVKHWDSHFSVGHGCHSETRQRQRQSPNRNQPLALVGPAFDTPGRRNEPLRITACMRMEDQNLERVSTQRLK